MSNYIPATLVPDEQHGQSHLFGELASRFFGFINARWRITGHVWQGRFGSVAMEV